MLTVGDLELGCSLVVGSRKDAEGSMSEIVHQLARWFNRSGSQEWVIVLAAVLVIGLFTLRGFGSRSDY